jgi:tape measure domain-containing protein
VATERLIIEVTAKGARVVSGEIGEIGKQAKTATPFVQSLRNTIGLIAASATVRTLIQMSDTFTSLSSRMRLVAADGNLARQTLDSLRSVANDTRQSFQATTELFLRAATATRDLGVSNEQLVAFTRQLNQAIRISGAGASEAANSLFQLSQALGQNRLRAEEFNSIIEQTPFIIRILQDDLGKTQLELRKMIEAGEITAKTFIDAFSRAEGRLESMAGTMTTTVGQAVTVLKNNVLALAGEFSSASGAGNDLAESILGIADAVQKAGPFLNKLLEPRQRFAREMTEIRRQLEAQERPDLVLKRVVETRERIETIPVETRSRIQPILEKRDVRNVAEEEIDALGDALHRLQAEAEKERFEVLFADPEEIPLLKKDTPERIKLVENSVMGVATSVRSLSETFPALTEELENLRQQVGSVALIMDQLLLGTVQEFTDSLFETLGRGGTVQDFFADLGRGIGSLAGQVARLITQFLILSAISGGDFSFGSFRKFLGLQSGGFAEKGRPIVVGERRPELFVPETSGRIVPNVNVEAQAAPAQVVVLQREEDLETFLLSRRGRRAVRQIVRT